LTQQDNTAPTQAPAQQHGSAQAPSPQSAPTGQEPAQGGDKPQAPAGHEAKAPDAEGRHREAGQESAKQEAPAPEGQKAEAPKPAEGPKGPGQGGGQQNKRPGRSGPKQTPKVVEVRPAAGEARLRRRHLGLILSLGLIVVLPLCLIGAYLWLVAEDQYASKTGFTVRQEEAGSASDLLGGLAEFAGAGQRSDSDILYEYIRSQELVQLIRDDLDIVGHYSQHWPDDPAFALRPDATIEDLVDYWQRIVRISYDQSSGLIELRVIGYDPAFAQEVAQAIVAESQNMINALNDQARADLMQYAQQDLDRALERLRAARQALTEFRTRTRIVDPTADVQGQFGVLNNLQQQLAEALIEYDLLSGVADPNDPRLVQIERRIEVTRDRIAQERETLSSDVVSGVGVDFPTLMAEYESLVVDREFAEETYRAALSAFDIARDKASRQSRYLATYVRPTLAQSSEYPQRVTLFGLAALFLTMIWAIIALVYYSIRDRQ
jgi:capsular polysaccharide transport system permease protein